MILLFSDKEAADLYNVECIKDTFIFALATYIRSSTKTEDKFTKLATEVTIHKRFLHL